MKKIFYIIPLLILVACEDKYEDTQKFNRSYYLYKEYPILLDASGILVDIQVKPSITPNAVFKIASSDKYFFVGEKMKGIHVYEKNDAYHATPLCFIECKYMKAFDVTDNILYCNNFTDLLAVDVEKPLQAKIKYRYPNFFNNYSTAMMMLYNGSMYTLANKRIVLTGMETDTNPAPDFSEYDKLYENLVVKEIPDTLQSEKPYAGFVNIKGKVYTFGYNTLANCSYADGMLKFTQSIVNLPMISNNPIYDLRYKDGMVYLLGKTQFGYLNFDNVLTQNNYYLYMSNIPLDVVSIKKPENSFVVLTENNIRAITLDTGYGFNTTPVQDVSSLECVNDTILALGKQLTLYRYPSQSKPIESVKQYPDISGSCMIKNGNTLITAGNQGLSFYDISDLENIKLIP